MQIFTIALYELKRIIKLRVVVLILFIMPLVLIFILGSALSSEFSQKEAVIKTIPVAIFSEDNGLLQQQFNQFLQSDAIKGMIQSIQVSSEQQLIEQIKAGEANFGIVLPKGFSSSVMEGKEAEMGFFLGRSRNDNFTAELVFQSFLDTVNGVQSVVKVLGPQQAQAIQAAAGQDRGEANRPNDYVKVGKLSNSDKPYTAVQYYAAAMMIMFILYGGMTAAISLNEEKEKHTLERLYSMPVKPYKVVLGKMIGNSFLAMIQATLIITFSAVFYDVDWGLYHGYLVIACIFLIVASMSLGVIAAMLFKTTKTVNSALQTVIILMTFLSGGFSPTIGDTLRKLGEFTINHWAMQSILNLMLHSGKAIVLHDITVLGLIAGGLMIVSVFAYRRVSVYE